jgi:hypothetical protein
MRQMPPIVRVRPGDAARRTLKQGLRNASAVIRILPVVLQRTRLLNR